MAEDPLTVKTRRVNKPDRPHGSVEDGAAAAYAYLPTSIAAIQATNDLLRRGVGLLRAPAPFNDRGRDFVAGVFVLPTSEPDADSIADELAARWALDVLALDDVPAAAIAMRQQRIAVYFADAGGAVLLSRFGFDFDAFRSRSLDDGDKPPLGDYDLFITDDDLNPEGEAAVQGFLGSGGDYIGIGRRGVELAEALGILMGSTFSYDGSANAIVRLAYDETDPVGTGFGADGYGFVYMPLFFDSLGAGVEVAVRYAAADLVLSGFWPGWQTSPAAGEPAVIHGEAGARDTTLIGLDPIFRAHPEDSFRLVANAIYSGLDP